MGVCSNELECVAFASSRNFTRGSTSREGPLCIFFRQTFPCACRVCVPISVANGEKTWPPNTNTHTHRQFELYILDHCIVNFGVHGVSTALATSQGSSQAC